MSYKNPKIAEIQTEIAKITKQKAEIAKITKQKYEIVEIAKKAKKNKIDEIKDERIAEIIAEIQDKIQYEKIDKIIAEIIAEIKDDITYKRITKIKAKITKIKARIDEKKAEKIDEIKYEIEKIINLDIDSIPTLYNEIKHILLDFEEDFDENDNKLFNKIKHILINKNFDEFIQISNNKEKILRIAIIFLHERYKDEIDEYIKIILQKILTIDDNELKEKISKFYKFITGNELNI